VKRTYIVVGLGVGRGGVGRVGRLGVSRVGAGSSNGDQKSENEDLKEKSSLVSYLIVLLQLCTCMLLFVE